MFLQYLEFRAAGWFVWSSLTLVFLVYTVFVLIISRVHYIIDIIFGFIISHYIWIMWDRYSYVVDYYIFGIPLEKRIATDDQNIFSKEYLDKLISIDKANKDKLD